MKNSNGRVDHVPSLLWDSANFPRQLFPLFLPAILGILIFLPTLHHDFIFDDNGEMQNFDGLFTPGQWPLLFFRAQYQLYRPIKYLTLHMDYALWGWNPRGFHLTNILLHGAVCALVGIFLRQGGCSIGASLLGASWFAIHPVHVEAVAWITARGAMLSAMGVLAAVLCYVHWRATGRNLWLLFFTLAVAWAIFSKEDALMLIPALTAVEIWGIAKGEGQRTEDERINVTEQDTPNSSFILYPSSLRGLAIATGLALLVALLYLALRQLLLSGVEQGRWEHGLRGLLSTLPPILVHYIGELVLPVGPFAATMEPPVDFTSGFGFWFWICSALLVGGFGVVFFKQSTGSSLARRIKLDWVWFFLFLVPSMGFIPINAPAADRFLYLPSVAGAMGVAQIWDAVSRKSPRAKSVVGFALVSLLALLAGSALGYGGVWRDDQTLWTRVVQNNPKSYRGWNNLGVEANKRGEAEKGRYDAEKSLALKADYAEAMITRARALDKLGRIPEAEKSYRQALEVRADNTIALYMLADFLDRNQRLGEAESVYDKILELRPGFVAVQLAAGVLAVNLGKTQKAIDHWETALKYDPGNAMALHNLELARKTATKR